MPSSASSSSLYIIRASSPLSGGDTGGAALSRPVVERFASSFQTQESLDALCKKYDITKDFTAILPGGHHRACSPPPPPGSICVYAQALEAGMRFPLHSFFSEALNHFGVAVSQVAPNGWRVMAGFVVLSHFAGVPPSLSVFRHFFSLCAHKIKGWYGFRGKDSAGVPLFKGLPSCIKRWKEEFFFLKSPMPWPCPVKWGEPSKNSTSEPVLTKQEERVVAKLLRAHGAAVDLKTYLSEKNLAAARIIGSPPRAPPPPPSPRTASSAKGRTPGMDPSVYNMMQSLRAAKATQASGEKVTVKSEPGSDTPLSGKKRKRAEDGTKQGVASAEPNTQLGHGHGHGSVSGMCSRAPPGFSAQKTTPRSSVRDHDPPKSPHMPDQPDGDTTDWTGDAARKMLQSIVVAPRQLVFSAAKPSDVIQSSYVAMLQAANRVCFSLGYALELEEKVAAREREATTLRQELAQAKAELAEAKEASAGEARRAAAENALAGYERGMEDMKRAALRRYPHLDPDKLVMPPDGGGLR